MEKDPKEELQKIIDIQSQDGNWNYDPYMHGMMNGLILAQAILEDKEPAYKEAPEKWLSVINPIEAITELQKELGYKTGELSTVAMLGLVGEAGEVLGETFTQSDNSRFHMQMIETLAACKATDEYKKQIRKGDVKIFLDIEEQHKDKFDIELADTLYYLNILALNRGHDLNYYAQLSHDKVRAKMQTPTGSSEQQTR